MAVTPAQQLEAAIWKNRFYLQPVVHFDVVSDRLKRLDFTEANMALTAEVIENINTFCNYINETLQQAGARYGIGGYGEHRTVYRVSRHFDAPNPDEEPRRLHLGTDIWGPAGTPVMAPLPGQVHSMAFNNREGDYGATIILQHQLEGLVFYSLYGHLSLPDLDRHAVGQAVAAGEIVGHFGSPAENGHWPPHLHLQLILDLQGQSGDYPGVCVFSQKDAWLCNCPDPELVLQMELFIN
jgi:peptidoglycan LD-endopeptidase LytH